MRIQRKKLPGPDGNRGDLGRYRGCGRSKFFWGLVMVGLREPGKGSVCNENLLTDPPGFELLPCNEVIQGSNGDG